MTTTSKARLRWIAVLAITAALSAFAYAAAADDDVSTGDGVTQDAGDPIPVEPDGGIGDTPMPVEPDGGIGDTPMPVEPDGGIGDGAGPIPTDQG